MSHVSINNQHAEYACSTFEHYRYGNIHVDHAFSIKKLVVDSFIAFQMLPIHSFA